MLKTFHKEKFVLLIVLNCITYFSNAQCPDVSKINQEFRKYNQQNISISTYTKWLYQWEDCRFPIDSLYGFIHSKVGERYYLDQDFVLAKTHFEKSLAVFKKYDTKVSYIPKSLSIIGRCYYYLKDYKQAKELIFQSISLCNSKEYDLALSQNYLHLSSIFYDEGDVQLALQYLNKSVDFAKKSKNSYLLASVKNQQAIIFNSLGEYDKAQNHANDAIVFAQKSQDKELIARQYQMIGRIYANQKQLNEAIKSYLKAIEILGSLNPVVSTSLQINIGFLYLTKIKDYDKSLIHFKKALEIVKDPYQKLRIYNNIGYAYSQKKDFQNAFLNYQKGFQSLESTFNIKNFKINPSSILIKRASNKEYLLSLIIDKAETWFQLYETEHDKKSLTNALSTYVSIIQMIDYMRWEHRGEQSKLFWRKKSHKIYESAIQICFLLKDYEKAYYFFEKSRAVLLSDKLNELGAKQNLSEQDQKKESEIQSKIDELRKNILTKEKNRELVEKELILAENEQEKFIKSLEIKNPAYYQLKYDTTTFQLKEVQTYLKQNGNSTLIEYFVGDSATYAIVVSPNTVSLKKLNFNVNNTQQFVNLCSKKITTKTELNTFLNLGSKVYKSLIMPLSLSKGHLIISQDGLFLPFEALSKSVNNPDYLLNDFMISYTYSAQFLLRNKSKNFFLPNNKFIGIAPVNFTQKLNPLNGSDKSIDNIAKSYFWSNQLIGQEGNKKAFLSNAKNYQIVQIYTHAFADSNETEPRIYFADSALKVSDLSMADQFKTNLLVLSACKTGVGRVANGEGVLSLARGFSMAGIPATITSLWSIEDRDTYTLTELFYKYLKDGLPKDEALQKAKIEFIVNTENAMPNAWAGMVLIGDNSPLEKHKSLIFWILGGLALGGLGWYFKQKSPQKRAF